MRTTIAANNSNIVVLQASNSKKKVMFLFKQLAIELDCTTLTLLRRCLGHANQRSASVCYSRTISSFAKLQRLVLGTAENRVVDWEMVQLVRTIPMA